MFNITKKSIEWGGKTLTLETGKLARQADGAVLVSYGETQVLCTIVAAKEDKPGQDFFPLSVHYQSKYYAAGRMPGGFFKREAKPSEYDTLTSRLIDRPIRPMFHPDFLRETQVVLSLLSHDLENQPDIVAMIGASAALTISGVPFMGPIAGARVGRINGEFVLNPTYAELEESELDLVVAGTATSVLMVESEAKELSEATMLEAVEFGHNELKKVIKFIIDFAEKSAKDAWEVNAPDHSELKKKLANVAADKIRAAYKLQGKQERYNTLKGIKGEAIAALEITDATETQVAAGLLKKLEADVVRGDILNLKTRIDGRTPEKIRPIVGEAGILPRTHGSALFTRGETQALVVTTLGTGQDEQVIDVVEGESKQRFLLHYNFPSFSVGEVGRMAPPGRREIGHGKLALRALNAMIPSKEAFPYTIRLVSEITESNGSSSMATVCGGSMALMDAGVPIARPVAGIAMGLIKEGDKYVVLSDIMGDEDHLGDMDFKVAGTRDGITALQMDIKINGITTEIMQVALKQAQEGRIHILGEMAKAIDTSRSDLNSNAPRIIAINIPKDKIGELIGPGGKNIKALVEKSGAKIDIEEDAAQGIGIVRIASNDPESIRIAREYVEGMSIVPEPGKIYKGPIAKITDFGAFVTFVGSVDGLVHISEIENRRFETMADTGLTEGQQVYVKLLGVDRGKFKLSMKVVDQATGEDLDPEGTHGFKPREGGERSDRGERRGGDRDRRPRRANG